MTCQKDGSVTCQKDGSVTCQKDGFVTRQKDGSGPAKKTVLDPSKRRAINTNISNTNISNIDLSVNQLAYKENDITINNKKINDQTDGLNEFERLELYFENNVFTEIRESPTANSNFIDEIKMNVLDMYLAPATMINGERKCQDIVRAALMKLTPLHIDNVIYKFSNVNGQILNNKAYIQTMLYNESLESNLFMKNQVAADIANLK